MWANSRKVVNRKYHVVTFWLGTDTVHYLESTSSRYANINTVKHIFRGLYILLTSQISFKFIREINFQQKLFQRRVIRVFT